MDPPVSLARSVSDDSLVSLIRVPRRRPLIWPIYTQPTQDAKPDDDLGDSAMLILEKQVTEAASPKADGPRNNGQGPMATLRDLPVEIVDQILDLLFGEMGAIYPNPRTGIEPPGTWQRELRQPRRRELTDLALVNRVWTERVQLRIYRHSKSLKGLLNKF